MLTHKGHIAAIFTVLVWGTTFVSTKVLLVDFTPVEILFFRFLIGFVVLCLAYPKIMRVTDKKHELYFIIAALSGITLYYLFENIALQYSFASNIAVLVSITPFFTALMAHYFLEGERLTVRFFVGFAVAITGIILISFNGVTELKLNPIGDILAILAAIVWGAYSVAVKKLSGFSYNAVQITRRVFLYGIIFMLPTLFFFDFHIDLNRFKSGVNLFNILFLGVGASAICFATWSYAMKLLGAVKASAYIYAVPVVTIIFAAIILKERLTAVAIIGTCLTLTGLIISESRFKLPKWRNK